jgi:hypothetical protein
MSDMSGQTEPDNIAEPYVGSSTYHASSAAKTSQTRREVSPSIEGPYGLPSSGGRERIPVDRMQIDPPAPSRAYPAPDGRAQYQPDGRTFPSDGRGYAPDGRSYPPDTNMTGGNFGARPPVTSAYGQEPRYALSYPPQPNDGAPPGYVRQGNYFVPVSSYEPAPSVPGRADPYGAGFPQQPQGREPRDARYQQPEYSDPRYAYPSPAATVSSVARDREPVTSAPQQRFAHNW